MLIPTLTGTPIRGLNQDPAVHTIYLDDNVRAADAYVVDIRTNPDPNLLEVTPSST